MSQNKTVIQGLEPDSNFGGQSAGVNQGFYARSGRPAARGTIVPGMEELNSPEQGAQRGTAPTGQSQVQPQRVVQPGKPIVGFLYSISRTPVGEYWPLQIGRNTIGQSSDCDIVLGEATVSANHAVIVIRQGKNGIVAAIKDPESTNGTFVNGERLDFEAEECHNGDVITIGNNYQLLFILVDAVQSGLATSKDFMPIDVEEQESSMEDDIPPFNPGGATRPGGFDPFDNGSSWGGGTSGFTPSNGTVGMDGSYSGSGHGGTIPM